MALLHRFLDTPLALYSGVVPEMLDCLQRRFKSFESLLQPDEPKVEAASIDGYMGGGDPYDLVRGVAVIPIQGVLVNGPTCWWDETDYGSIASAVDHASANPEVRAIALSIASPGGEVSGLFDLVDSIYSARGEKPIWSILDDHAYSAAYGIASATDYITVPRTGGVGSVGVVTVHFDLSEMLAKHGIKPSIIQFGERKTDYSMFKPLSDDAQERLQGQIDSVGEMFVETVARNRGIARTRVRATQAATFQGADGVAAGFADAVSSPLAAFHALAESIA